MRVSIILSSDPCQEIVSHILNIGAGGYAGIFLMMKTGGLTELYGQNSQ